jgi:hypothetical protein
LILPTKRLPADRALLAIGAEVLLMLSRPQTVSKLWEETKRHRTARKASSPLPFDWFVLSLSLLYTMGAIDLVDGRLHRAVK